MKIIFIKTLKNIGQEGEIKDVSEGYARNFLFPKKIAVLATPEIIMDFQKKNQEKIKKEEDLKKSVQEKFKKINGKTFLIRVKTQGKKLFGSIGKKEICAALKKEGFYVDEKTVLLDNPIKEIGAKKISINLLKNVLTANIIIDIQPEQ